MKYKDYYKTLGLERGAAEDEIKKAYRKLARKYHPDVSKEANAKERFQEVSEAYETLKDQEKRAAYDSLGQYRPGQDFRPPPDWADRFGAQFGSPGETDLGGIDLSDLFASLGAGLRGRRGAGSGRFGGGANVPIPGEDQEVNVQIGLEDAARGTELSMEVSGREHDAQGRVVRKSRTIRARIPKGVTHGERMRLRGKGGAGFNGGPAGDLYLNISLRPHALFKPNGHDLYLEVPVRDWEAALGTQIEIPTLEGRVTLRIPPGSKSGHQLRLAGKGLPEQGGGAGNLYAVLSVVVPGQPSERERKLYEELRAASSSDPRMQFASR